MAEPFIGEIRMVGFNFAPRNWALANGQILPIAQNQALFSLLGVTYGGNGQTTFALPDLRGRVPMHFSTAYPQGAAVGEQTHTLTLAELPLHTHTIAASTLAADLRTMSANMQFASYQADNQGKNQYFSTVTPDQNYNPNTFGSAGGGQPHENMQPYQVLNFCVALTGVFPSRN